MGSEISDCDTNDTTNAEYKKGEKTELKQNEDYNTAKLKQPTMNRLRTVWITEQYPDTRFSAHYTKLKQIGKPGSFGTAFQCQRKCDGKIFAVKEISKAKIYRLDPSHKIRKKMLSRMEAEIDIMRRLKHKYIVNLHETYESKHELHIVMEECKGGELFARTKEKNGYQQHDTKRVIRMICEALFYMHAKHRIFHGDLKPENILFVSDDKESDIQIIDFGMSQICQPLKSLNTLCGTPYFIAPEVITGDYCHSADMWSVGVIAFVMIFGFPPFHVPPGTYYGVNEAKEIFKNVLKGFNSTVKRGYGAWFPKSMSDKLGGSGMHFIGSLLEMDVTKRLTAKEALQHRWLNDEIALNTKGKMDLDTLEMYQFASFAVSHKFKYAIASLFREQYKHLRPQHFKNLNNLFLQLDKDKNGKICYAEFKQGIMSKCDDLKLNADKISEIFNELDINKKGEIEFRNLLDAAVHDFIIASDARLYKAFRDLDEKNDGKISTNLLKQKICELNPYGSDNIDLILQIIDDVDLDKDGNIDYEEFLKVLHPDFNETPNWFWLDGSNENDPFIVHSASFESCDECKGMNENAVVKQGYMRKEGKIIRSWKKRWFVLLDNGIMSYYENRNDQEAISRLNVKYLTRLMYKSWSKTDKKRYGIKIYTPWRNWRFVCGNNEKKGANG